KILTPSGEDPELMRAQLRKHIDRLTKLYEDKSAEIDKLTEESKRPLNLSAEYETLKQGIANDEAQIKSLSAKIDLEKLELRAAQGISRFQDAELMKKDMKKQLLATAVVPLAVFSAVCGGLAMFDFRQHRVRNAGQVSTGLGIRVVGAVPDMPGLE